MRTFLQWMEAEEVKTLDYAVDDPYGSGTNYVTVEILKNPDKEEVVQLLQRSNSKRGKGLVYPISGNPDVYVWNDDAREANHQAIAAILKISPNNAFYLGLIGDGVAFVGDPELERIWQNRIL